MLDDRVIIPFPSDTIRLNGILQDTLSTIHCATSNLTYRDYMSVRSTFLFASEAVLMEAIKSLSARSEIAITTKVAATFAEKSLGNMSDEYVLASIFIMALEKTVAFHSEHTIESLMRSSSEKHINDLQNEFFISGITNFASEKGLTVSSEIGFENANAASSAKKAFEPNEIISEISSTANFVCEKYAGTLLSTVEFSSILKFSLAKYRPLNDIDSLSFSDIDQWTMDIFDKISV